MTAHDGRRGGRAADDQSAAEEQALLGPGAAALYSLRRTRLTSFEHPGRFADSGVLTKFASAEAKVLGPGTGFGFFKNCERIVTTGTGGCNDESHKDVLLKALEAEVGVASVDPAPCSPTISSDRRRT